MPTSPSVTLPELKELRAIYNVQKPYTRVTPLIPLEDLSNEIQGKIYLKAESLQKTGAFKFRGAIYRLLQLNNNERARGVIAYSSGNFARGLAAAGEILNIDVHLVMPADAPKIKIQSAEAHGANIKLCHEFEPTREEAAAQLAHQLSQQHGLTLLHPFDDPELIKGQSAVALELSDQLKELEISCDNLLCPTGGGSLIAGSSMIFDDKSTQLFAVEAEGYEGMTLSIEKGVRARAHGKTISSCDALQAISPGKNNFEVIRHTEVIGLPVKESYINQAIQHAASHLKLILEPSGAISLAALFQYPEKFRGQTTVIIASGGNIDIERYADIISH
ncbi:threonine ammonia-lyase [Endozoicomonas arenosclerae]|uniref:threonine ammonia-lyase n=1 Tax=Endozoicomonas arenosclerae TaxID=1633495 RepID=UPI0007815790|nr:threonine/serine dehydratase [Endozoicomonas arenosclerae]